MGAECLATAQSSVSCLTSWTISSIVVARVLRARHPSERPAAVSLLSAASRQYYDVVTCLLQLEHGTAAGMPEVLDDGFMTRASSLRLRDDDNGVVLYGVEACFGRVGRTCLEEQRQDAQAELVGSSRNGRC